MTRRWILAMLAAGSLGLLIPGGSEPSAAGRRASFKETSSAPRARHGKAGRRFQRRQVRLPLDVSQGAAEVRLDPIVDTAQGGGRVVLRVMLLDGSAGLQHASFDVGADPAHLRFTGFVPTGRGALMVRESPSTPGLVSVYRSALPGGFDAFEVLAELEFDGLTTGSVPVSLSEVRVLDDQGRDVAWTVSVGDLVLE